MLYRLLCAAVVWCSSSYTRRGRRGRRFFFMRYEYFNLLMGASLVTSSKPTPRHPPGLLKKRPSGTVKHFKPLSAPPTLHQGVTDPHPKRRGQWYECYDHQHAQHTLVSIETKCSLSASLSYFRSFCWSTVNLTLLSFPPCLSRHRIHHGRTKSCYQKRRHV